MHFGHKHNHNKKANAQKPTNTNDDVSQVTNSVSPPPTPSGSVGGLGKSLSINFMNAEKKRESNLFFF